mmetsp:Transcript_59821/g.97753  ORF Transcript_59821/g.97753 Transcript_59821/m.97753 type:complete len:307 (-) Transcript_59821:25-945(-)
MPLRKILTAFCLSEMLLQSSSFPVISNFASQTPGQRSGVSQLNVAASLDYGSEEAAFAMMQRAKECANSDTCSLEEAEEFLSSVLHIQSGCASGALVGEELCEDQDVAAEIVAGLRAKIEKGVSIENRNIPRNVLLVTLAASMLSVAALSMVAVQPDATPFTLQEWWWAIQGGYLNTMLEHYVRHGGLSVVDYEPTAVPFTLQEWWWSLSGGYFDRMVLEHFQNGGLLVSEYQLETSPITLQEWWWALSGGFLNTMIVHNYQNGGLLTGADYHSDTVAFTPTEWFWAAKDGYIETIAQHFFRNGGL